MNETFPFRLIAIDLDETLLGPDKTISARNRETISLLQAKKVAIVLASGRSRFGMIPHHAMLGLTTPVISLNGALVAYVAPYSVVDSNALPKPIGKTIVRKGIGLGLTVVFCCQDRTYASSETEMLLRYQSRGGEKDAVIGVPGDLEDDDILKIVWIAEPEFLDDIELTEFAKDKASVNVLRTASHHLEFLAPAADKAHGLQLVASLLGIPQIETIAIGDGAQMLRWAGFYFAESRITEPHFLF